MDSWNLGPLGPPHGRGVLAVGLVLAAALTPVAIGLGELSACAGNTVVAMSLTVSD